MQCILEQWGANELCEATVRFRKGLLTVFMSYHILGLIQLEQLMFPVSICPYCFSGGISSIYNYNNMHVCLEVWVQEVLK